VLSATPMDKFAAESGPEAAMVTQEMENQPVTPMPETTALEARQPGGLPALRWVEIGLAAVALALAAVTLRTRRRAR